MQQERKTLDELSTSQATEFFRLDSEETAAIGEVGRIIAARAAEIAEKFHQLAKALPGAPKLMNESRRNWHVRHSVVRWLSRLCTPWHRVRTEAYLRRLAAMYARAGVPATYITAGIALLDNLCTAAIYESFSAREDRADLTPAITAYRKRLAMDELGILGWHTRHLRNSLRAQKAALEAMVLSRSATLRSTVAFSQCVAEEIDEEQVIRALADNVMKNIKPDGLIIHTIQAGDLAEPQLTFIKGRITAAPSNVCAQALRNDWQLCRAARTARGFHVADVCNALVKCPYQELPQREGSYCCIPLAGGIKVHGWMHLTKTQSNAFSDEELEVLSIYGQMVGTAITSLRLVKENRHQATTDPLTGLYNRRHFHNMLNKEELLLKRRGGCGSLVMIDVDKFKQFNDMYGHEVGDRILKSLADSIRQTVRATDELARLGGDEFVLLLRDCNGEEGVALAEKIREAASRLSIRLDSQKSAQMTISLGVASFPDHGSTLENTLLLADMGLLQAKDTGGNAVALFQPSMDNSALSARAIARKVLTCG